ncbi:MAG: acylphosphatase [bacterium]|nr:acylphosphatase [bacterium]
MSERIHLLIQGRVQGVGYRMSAQWKARELELCGWVRNRPDGVVELVAEGPAEVLDALIAWCRSGPPMARVRDVQITREAARGGFSSFEIR